MEAREEAMKCRNISEQAFKQGNYDKALRFIEKSIRICPTVEAETLLKTIKRNEPPPVKAFTKVQEVLCSRILAATDLYSVLDLRRDASDEEIKKAYRKMALQLHPDKNGAPRAEDAFKRISNAFQTLSDPKKRSHYDRTGDEHVGSSTTARSASSYSGDGFIDPEELFRAFFGVGLDGFGSGATMFRTPDGQTFRRVQTERINLSAGQRRIYGILQLLPFILILLFSSFGNSVFNTNRVDYRLVPKPDTPHLIRTETRHVPFYTSSTFLSRYPARTAGRFEVETEVEYGYFYNECFRAHEDIRKKMAHYRVAGQSAKLEELLAQLRSKENENTHCQIMKQIQVRDR